MASENATWQRFPDQIVPDSAHTPEWNNSRVSTIGADARTNRQSRPYWKTDLTDCVANEEIKDTLLGMIWRNKGDWRPVLNRVSVFCEIGVTTHFNPSTGNAVVAPEFQGTFSAGVTSTFQLRKRLIVKGYESEYLYYDVTKPQWQYPVRDGIARTSTGPVAYQDEMPDVQLSRMVSGNLVPMNNSNFSINRDTGIVTLNGSAAGDVYAQGGFYVLMLMPNISFTRKGGTIVIGNVQMVEPHNY